MIPSPGVNPWMLLFSAGGDAPSTQTSSTAREKEDLELAQMLEMLEDFELVSDLELLELLPLLEEDND